MKEKVIIIGAVSHYVLTEFDWQVQKLGLEACYIFAEGNIPEAWQGYSFCIEDLEVWRAEQAYQLLCDEDIEPVSIVPAGELAVPLVNALASRYGLPYDKGDINRFRNKVLMRKTLDEGLVSQPEVYDVLHLQMSELEIDKALEHLNFPLIMKPADGAASFFVKKCFSCDEIKENLARIREHRRSGVTGVSFSRAAILEQYIPGDEYSAEILVLGGQILNFFLHKKILSAEPYFDEIGHVTVPEEKMQEIPSLADFLNNAVLTLRPLDGVLHLEFRGPLKIGIAM